MTLAELGERLKTLRKEKGLSLSDIADKIKISARVLEHVENGNRDGLPHIVYAKGFLISYGTLLGISQEEMQEYLQEIFNNESIEDSHVAPSVLTRSMKKKSNTLKWLMLFFLLLIFLFIIGGAKIFKKEFYDLSHINIVELIKKPFVAASFKQPSSFDPPIVEPVLPKAVEATPPVVSEEKESVDPLMNLENEEQPSPDVSSPIKEDISMDTPSLDDQVEESGQSNHLIRLTVDKEQCWVGYEIDGHEQKNETLRSGDTKEYFYTDSFRLILGNPSAVRLWHDGKLFTRTFDGSRREILQFP